MFLFWRNPSRNVEVVLLTLRLTPLPFITSTKFWIRWEKKPFFFSCFASLSMWYQVFLPFFFCFATQKRIPFVYGFVTHHFRNFIFQLLLHHSKRKKKTSEIQNVQVFAIWNCMFFFCIFGGWMMMLLLIGFKCFESKLKSNGSGETTGSNKLWALLLITA